MEKEEKNTVTIKLAKNIDFHTDQPQKFVVSTATHTFVESSSKPTFVISPTTLPLPLPCIMTQEDDDIPEAPDQLVDNTQAKKMTQTITQDFAQLATEKIMTTKVKPEDVKQEFAGAILDKETGEQMEYWQLIKTPKYK